MTDSPVIKTYKELMVAEAKHAVVTFDFFNYDQDDFDLYDLDYEDFEVIIPQRFDDRIEITVFFHDGLHNQRIDMEVRKGFPLRDSAFEEIYNYDWSKSSR